jgi:hypothetical protein
VITYADLTAFAPPASDKDERDQWFRDHGYEPDDLLRVGREVAEWRLADLEEGALITAETLVTALVLACTFGFELCLRCERDEKPDLSPPQNGSAD